jgi:hypothetical protein
VVARDVFLALFALLLLALAVRCLREPIDEPDDEWEET